MGKKLELEGQKFNFLTVLNQVESAKNGNIKWLCKCDCGNTTIVTGSRIKNGITKSCGCICKDNSLGNTSQYKHGLSRTSEYRAWQDAKLRCTKTDHRQWDYYGGRGIKMQESWLLDFENFYLYLGPKPSKLHSLDRFDNDSDYCEGNVRWATKTEQVANRGKNVNNKTGVTGVVLVTNIENGFEHYKAFWGSKKDKHCRSFSVNKYGRQRAFDLAIEAREKGLSSIKDKDGYTEKHGLERGIK